MNDQSQDGIKCFWRKVAVYRENNSSGGTPDEYFAAAYEIERLSDQVVVDTGIIKSHFERIEELESALKKIRYSSFTPTPEREIARKVLSPDSQTVREGVDMAIHHIIPKGIWPGIKFLVGSVEVLFLAHTWQCGQRFTGFKGKRNRKVGYQTYGDASRENDTYKCGGWYWVDDYFTKRGLKHT